MERTREDKRKELIGEHLPYEVTMLQNAYGFIAIKTNEINCCIESFAIHARSVLEFFECIDPKGATASEFTVAKYDPTYVDKIRPETIKKLHNQIAHLSIDRTKRQEDKLGGPESVS